MMQFFGFEHCGLISLIFVFLTRYNPTQAFTLYHHRNQEIVRTFMSSENADVSTLNDHISKDGRNPKDAQAVIFDIDGSKCMYN